MTKKLKSVADTKPQLFKTPYAGMQYMLVQDHAQLKKLKGSMSDSLQKALPLAADHHFLATTWFKYVEGEGFVSVIYYPTLLTDDLTRVLVTLCHECVHVWQSFHKEVICEPNPSDEFEAYTIDSIFHNIVEEHRRLMVINEADQGRTAIEVTKTAA